MFRPLVFLCSFVLLGLNLPVPARAGDEVLPPFGLAWDICGRELEAHLLTAKAQIVERKRLPDGEVWTVEALPQAELRRAIFTLKGDGLSEVQLQYGNPEWDIWTFDEFMHRVRQGLEARFGTGRQVARQRDAEAAVMQTLVGYHWNIAGRAMELVYFAAQDEKNALRLVSLHYKASEPAERPKLAQQ